MNLISLPPKLEKNNVPDYFNELKKLDLTQPAQLTVDGSKVEYIDAAGLALLIELKSMNIKLINLSNAILQISRLYHIQL